MTRCDCNGMQFICNRWVFTGDCPHRRERRVQEEMERRYRRRDTDEPTPSEV